MVTTLNLSHNNIDCTSVSHVVRMLTRSGLQAIYLRWNQIREVGGAALFEALKNNKSLEILDVSYNSFRAKNHLHRRNQEVQKRKWYPDWDEDEGIEEPDPETIENQALVALRHMFEENETLLHCDFSYNNFTV